MSTPGSAPILCPVCRKPLHTENWRATATLSGLIRSCPDSLSCGYVSRWTKDEETNQLIGITTRPIQHEERQMVRGGSA